MAVKEGEEERPVADRVGGVVEDGERGGEGECAGGRGGGVREDEGAAFDFAGFADFLCGVMVGRMLQGCKDRRGWGFVEWRVREWRRQVGESTFTGSLLGVASGLQRLEDP